MTLNNVLKEIRTHRFSSLLNLASDERQFYKIAQQQPAVKTLAHYVLNGSGESREEVLSQIWDLSSVDIDPRYENPYDTPLAIMLWLVSFVEPYYAPIAAGAVDRARQCWHAKKLARKIMFPTKNSAGIGTADHQPSPEVPSYSNSTGKDLPMWVSFVGGASGGSHRFTHSKSIINASSSDPSPKRIGVLE